jgi:hypothetical protein
MFKQLIELKDKYFPSKKYLENVAEKELNSKAIVYFDELSNLTTELAIPFDSGYHDGVDRRCVKLLNNIIMSGISISNPQNKGMVIKTFEEAYRFRNCLELLTPELAEPATSMLQPILEATERARQDLLTEDDRITSVTKDSDGLNCLAVEDKETNLVLSVEYHPRRLIKIEDKELGEVVTDLSWLSTYELHQIGKAISDFIEEHNKMKARGMRKFYTEVYKGLN